MDRCASCYHITCPVTPAPAPSTISAGGSFAAAGTLPSPSCISVSYITIAI